MEKEYYLGLDVVTNSIGWCLTDTQNNIAKVKGKHLWGVRLFEESNDAKDRRTFRSSRRRLQRRKQRINLLREIFAEEIHKVDPTFFERLDESFFNYEDRKNKTLTTLFIEKDFNDSDYFKKFPTVFHLRNYLMEISEKADIRFIYLALSNIMKNRGHSLIENFDASKSLSYESFKSSIDKICSLVSHLAKEETFNNFNENKYNVLIETFNSGKTKNDKKLEYNSIFDFIKSKCIKKLIASLLANSDVSPKILIEISHELDDFEDFSEDDLPTNEDFIKNIIDENLEEKCERLINNYPLFKDVFEIIKIVKVIYDGLLLNKLLGKDNNSISKAMINKFNEYKKDLRALKNFVNDHYKQLKFNIFRKFDFDDKKDKDSANNYVKYTGFNSCNSIKTNVTKCSKDAFYAFLKKQLRLNEVKFESDVNYCRIIDRMTNGDFLDKLKNPENGVFPRQLHEYELKIILEKQSKFYPFLNEVSEGLTNKEKINRIFNFQIPYFVGPLILSNDPEKTKYSWMKVKDEYKNVIIKLWNFTDVIDLDATAEEFIKRMQNKCTYLRDQYCLPKSSIILNTVFVLDFLNTLQINGQRMILEDRNNILKNLFMNKAEVTFSDIHTYFKNKYNYDVVIPQEDKSKTINVNLKSFITLKNIFGEQFINKNIDFVEDIIRDITIFTDKNILRRRLNTKYNLDGEKIKLLCQINDFKDFGRYSKKLITNLPDKYGKCIIDYLLNSGEDTGLNFMEIYNEFGFNDIVNDYNLKHSLNKTLSIDEFIDDLSIPKKAHRAIKQSYLIIEELKKIIGKGKITKYFIEFTRYEDKDKKGKLVTSRYKDIETLLNSCYQLDKDIAEVRNLFNEKISTDKGKLKSEKYYLYFTQLGRSLYSGEKIDFEKLAYGDTYDVDHIYPQALVKDDSLIKNKVLVEKDLNNLKSDTYPIDTNILWKNKGGKDEAYKFFKFLKDKGFMDKEKYQRLIKHKLGNHELDDFINRQKVITDQSAIGIVSLLKNYMHVDSLDIVYSKATNVSTFRNEFDIIKSRLANNFHHAHDAYLNVVVGNIVRKYFNDRFIRQFSDLQYFKKEGLSANIDYLLKKDKLIDINGELIWDKKRINKIKKYIYGTYDIFITERAYKKTKLLEKVSIVKDGKIPVKEKEPYIYCERYGGFSDPSWNNYCLVEVNNDVLIKSKSNIVNNSNKNEKILIDNLKINTVIKEGDLKYIITGKNGNSYLIKNFNERYFNENNYRIIRKIEKIFNNPIIKKNSYLLKDEESIKQLYSVNEEGLILSKRDNNNPIHVLKYNEINELYEEIIRKFNSKTYCFSNILNIRKLLIENNSKFLDLNIGEKILLINELLGLLKVNERKTADLTIIGGKKTAGVITMSEKLHKGQKIIYESVTGFYNKVVWDYDKWDSE